jgi:hypothetical protein
MAQAKNPSTIFPSLRGVECSPAHLLRITRTRFQQLLSRMTGQITPDPKAWRVTRAGDVILPNRKIELRARPAARRMAAA